MLRDWYNRTPPEYLAVGFVALVAALLLAAVLVVNWLEGRDAMLLSEREARELKRDQARFERRRKLAQLQRRLGFRRSA